MTQHKIILSSSEDMSLVEDASMDLVVTSPPYNVGKKYGDTYDDTEAYGNYINMLRTVFINCYSKLKDFRYCCVNVARDSNVPLSSDITQLMCEIGFNYNKRIVWLKPEGAANQTMTMKYPHPRYYEPKLVTEDIVVFTKGNINGNRGERIVGEELDDARLRKYSTNVWFINPETDSDLLSKHPCPYPEELMMNLISFYTRPGEKVLDPFLGTGTTMRVARMLGRSCVGFEINKDYKELILERTGLLYSGLSSDTYEVI